MRVTQVFLVALMAYEAHAGLFTGDTTNTYQTDETKIDQTTGPGGSVDSTLGPVTTGNGPSTGPITAGDGGNSTTIGGSVNGPDVHLDASHQTTSGNTGPVNVQQTNGPCTGSCISYQNSNPVATTGDAVDNSNTNISGVGNQDAKTGDVTGGSTAGGSTGPVTQDGNGGDYNQTQNLHGGKSGDNVAVPKSGDKQNTNSHQESTSFSPTLAIPLRRDVSVKRYMPGAYHERNADVLV